MGTLFRLYTLAAIALLLAGPSLAEPGSLDEQKQALVRSSLAKQGRPSNAILLDAATRAAAVTSIEVTGTNESPVVRIGLDGTPAYEWFEMDGGERIVVDLHNTVNLKSGSTVKPDSLDCIAQVRTSQYSLEPAFVSRVVVETNGGLAAALSMKDSYLEVLLKPGAGEASGLLASISNLERDLNAQSAECDVVRARVEEALLRAKTSRAGGESVLSGVPADQRGPKRMELAAALDDCTLVEGEILSKLETLTQSSRDRIGAQRASVSDVKRMLESQSAEESAARGALRSIEKEMAKQHAAEKAAFAELEESLSSARKNATVKLARHVLAASDEAAYLTLGSAPPLVPGESVHDEPANASQESATSIHSFEQPTMEPAESESDNAEAEIAMDGASIAAAARESPAEPTESSLQETPIEIAKATEASSPVASASAEPGTSPITSADISMALDSLSKDVERLRSEEAQSQSEPKDQANVTTTEKPDIAPPSELPASEPIDPAELAVMRDPFVPAPLIPRVNDAGKKDTVQLAAVPDAEIDIAPRAIEPSAATSGKRPASAEMPKEAEAGFDSMKGLFDSLVQAHTAAKTSVSGATVDVEPEPIPTSEPVEAPIQLAAAEPSPEPTPNPEPPGTQPGPTVTVTVEDAQSTSQSGEAPQPEPEPMPQPVVQSTPMKPLAVATATAEMDDTIEPASRRALPAGADPLDQIVNIDFREMDLSAVVSLLAKKAQVNVIAGTDVVGTVTAEIRNVPLRKAMDMVLRMNGLGIIEEEGIFRIVPYEEAVAARRKTVMVTLDKAQADDVKLTLDGILIGSPDQKLMTIAANAASNIVVISGPEERVAEFQQLVMQLDVAEPTLPTITDTIKLSYLEPRDAKVIAESMITQDGGKVEADEQGRHLIVTDLPIVVEQIREVLEQVDSPVKQVAIDTMIVDAVLRDASQTGVDWMVEAIRRHSTNGDLVSDVSELAFNGALGNIGTDNLDAGVLTLGILSSEVRIAATIAAEAQSRNAQILANPSVVTVENQTASIQIVQDFPYQELTQGLTGPPVATTEFKPIGVTLEVTPRVTHSNESIVKILAKQSSVSGLTESGVPIEDKREAETTLRAANGQTIFIGGLRNISDRLNVSKIPVLGDIPVLSFMFRNTDVEKINTELLIFLTCSVVEDHLPDLTPSQQYEYDKIDGVPRVPDAQRANFRDIVRPQDMRDPMWKWRRSKL